jgi:hypothetical protein
MVRIQSKPTEPNPCLCSRGRGGPGAGGTPVSVAPAPAATLAGSIITTLPRAQRSVRQRRDATSDEYSNTQILLGFQVVGSLTWRVRPGNSLPRPAEPGPSARRAPASDAPRLTTQDLTDAEAQQCSVFSVLETLYRIRCRDQTKKKLPVLRDVHKITARLQTIFTVG